MRVRQIVRTEPDWLATVDLDDGSVMSLTFLLEPTEAEVLARVEEMLALADVEFEVEAKDGTII